MECAESHATDIARVLVRLWRIAAQHILFLAYEDAFGDSGRQG